MREPVIPITLEQLQTAIIEKGIDPEQLGTAIQYAEQIHGLQKTKDGESFLEHHLWPVANEYLVHLGTDTTAEDVEIAILHDSLEDDPNPDLQGFKSIFSSRAVDSVVILSRQIGRGSPRQSDYEYWHKIGDSNETTRLIKLADRWVNVFLVRRMKDIDPDKFKAYILETKEYALPLAKDTSQKYYELFAEWLKKNEGHP